MMAVMITELTPLLVRVALPPDPPMDKARTMTNNHPSV